MRRILSELFGTRRRHYQLGVEFTDTQLRLVSLSKRDGQHRVEAVCIAELGSLGDTQNAAQCLGRMVESMGAKGQRVSLAIKSSSAFIKSAMLDATLSRREIDARMLSEADSALPYALDEVYIDYAVVESNPSSVASHLIAPTLAPQELSPHAAAYQKMLLVACKADVLDPIVRIAEQAGIRLDAVDLDSFALERAIMQSTLLPFQAATRQPLGVVALILFESGHSCVHLFHNGRHKLHREWGHGQMDFDSYLKDQFKDQFKYKVKAEAEIREETRVEVTTAIGSARLEHYREVANETAAQVRTALSQLTSDGVEDELSLAFLGGEDALVSGVIETDLIDEMAESLLCEVRSANPFRRMTLGEGVDPIDVNQNSPLLMVACGLAMREAST
ncbi:MAG: pilus assembly protein PilM [Pseudomonadales bacterium]|nr:pilus assembly protein PilM [Pseudomonadales bacterium]